MSYNGGGRSRGGGRGRGGYHGNNGRGGGRGGVSFIVSFAKAPPLGFTHTNARVTPLFHRAAAVDIKVAVMEEAEGVVEEEHVMVEEVVAVEEGADLQVSQ